MATKIITTNVCDACNNDIAETEGIVSLHVRRVTEGAGRPRKGATVDLHTDCIPAWLPVPESATETPEDGTEPHPEPEPADAPKTTRKRGLGPKTGR